MKKYIKGIICPVILCICFGLISCGANPKDVKAPVFSGVSELNAILFEECNLLENVTATDETDGDVTDLIEVAVLPFSDVNNGVFRPKTVGEYQVVYKVKDKCGNEAKAYSKVIVSGGDDRPLFKAFDFHAKDLGSADVDCYNHTEAGAAGRASFDNGKLVYSVEKFGEVDWYNKLTLINLSLVSGKKYSVEFKASATNALTFVMFVNINGGSWNPALSAFVSLTDKPKEYAFETTTVSLSGNYALFLQFGGEQNKSLPATEIAFDYVRIYEI